MSSHDSEKAEKRRVRNRQRKSDVSTAINKLSQAINAKDTALIERSFNFVQSRLMKAKTKGVLKANTVSRKIKRLYRRVRVALGGGITLTDSAQTFPRQ